MQKNKVSRYVLMAAMMGIGFIYMTAAMAEEKILWTGCGITKNAFTKELAAAFEDETKVSVEVRGGGAMKGIRQAVSGSTDIGGTCRLALDVPEEKGAKLTHVAWDALVMIVPESNPVENLSSEQVQGIITGDLKNWQQLGGDDEPIEFYARRGLISGVGYMFRTLFFGDPMTEFTNAIEVPRSSGLIEMLAGKGKGTLGISGASSAHKRKGIKMLALDGVLPTKANVMSGKYRLIRPLYYATGPTLSAPARRFVDFALSKKGQQIISDEGVVNLAEGRMLSAIFRQRFGEEYLAPSVE